MIKSKLLIQLAFILSFFNLPTSSFAIGKKSVDLNPSFIVHDIILDLDGTLIYSFPSPQNTELEARPYPGGPNTPYGLAHGAIEFLSVLSAHPQFRVSFFSLGSEYRNQTVVSALKERIIKTTQHKPIYKVFSESHAIHQKKVLSSLSRYQFPLNLDHSLLIDDHDYQVQGESKNLLLLKENMAAYSEPNRCDERISNELIWALGVILSSAPIESSLPFPGSSQTSNPGLNATFVDRVKFYSTKGLESKEQEMRLIGLRAIQRIQPHFDLISCQNKNSELSDRFPNSQKKLPLKKLSRKAKL